MANNDKSPQLLVSLTYDVLLLVSYDESLNHCLLSALLNAFMYIFSC